MINPFLNPPQVPDAEVLRLQLESKSIDVQLAAAPSRPDAAKLTSRKSSITTAIQNHK